MEYMTARAQPTPKTNPRNIPISALEKKSTMISMVSSGLLIGP
jgi:hypothetical protein